MKFRRKLLGVLCVAAVMLAAAPFRASAAGTAEASVTRPDSAEGTVQTEDGGLLWTDALHSLTYTMEVPAPGRYAMEITYAAKESHSDFIQMECSVSCDTFQDAFSVELARPVAYGRIQTLDNGDQVRPQTQLSATPQTVYLRLTNQVTNGVCVWDFPAGTVRVTLEGTRTDFLLYRLRLVPYEGAQPYAQVRQEAPYASAFPAKSPLRIQAENLDWASEPSLGAQYDRSDALVEPSNPGDLLLNIAGGANFSRDGQWMAWKLDVEESGLYTLKFRARQAYKNGLSVNRRIYIDGRVPFQEAENLAFSYAPDWQIVTLRDAQGEEAPIYLEKGTHTLRLEVVPGESAEAIVGITALTSDLMDLYRSVVMITGVNPDRNRDYYLERDIPGLLDDLQAISQGLAQQRGLLEGVSGTKSGELASITTLQTQIASFLARPDTIAARLGNFKSNIDALASFMLTIREQPLDLDYILLAPPETADPRANAGFFQNLWFELRALICSFFPKDTADEDALTVWVSAGRDQMQVIKDMTDNTYTAQTGKKVRFSLVQQEITEAILAGNSPDVVLYAANTEVVNLAMRGALCPLDGVDGLEELMAECQSQAFVPYRYRGKCYGVPLTQSFPMLFVRTDIFAELGLEVPQTWEELYAMIPTIQRKNMQVGIPSSEATFGTMLWQRGQSFYNGDNTATNLANQTAVEVFRRYTRLFTDYDLPVTYDFYNRFRSGEMPIAIADYVEYNRLLAAAPEITGKWAMYPIPGTQRDGVLERSVQASAGMGGYVLQDSARREEAARFLLWFAGAQQQAEYGKKTEALLGVIGRYAPANQQAIAYLPWTPQELQLIKEQWQCVKEQPQMPGAYYTPRNLANAFRAVVYDGDNYREALLQYAAEIDRELARKRAEYGGKEPGA